MRCLFRQAPKIYNATGRMGIYLADKLKRKLTEEQKELAKKIFDDFTFVDALKLNESFALQYIELFEDGTHFELIWLRNSGVKDEIPNGYKFIGYDVSYPCDYSGAFSIICDCMFICCWHGCDKGEKMFASDFGN